MGLFKREGMSSVDWGLKEGGMSRADCLARRFFQRSENQS